MTDMKTKVIELIENEYDRGYNEAIARIRNELLDLLYALEKKYPTITPVLPPAEAQQERIPGVRNTKRALAIHKVVKDASPRGIRYSTLLDHCVQNLGFPKSTFRGTVVRFVERKIFKMTHDNKSPGNPTITLGESLRPKGTGAKRP
jgi:hypothetical protein